MSRQAIDPPASALPRLRMSYEEFLLFGDDTTHAEWVDGETIVFPLPLEIHQLFVGFLFMLLDGFTRLFDLGIVLTAPYEMKLSDGSSREPDLLFIAREHFDRRTPERLVGPADIAMEVASESTARYDRTEKFASFERSGLPEYWMFDPRPRRKLIEAFARSADGRLVPIVPDAEGRVHSTVLPGFWIDPVRLRQMPFPDVNQVMLELAPEAYRDYLLRLLGGGAHGDKHSGNGSQRSR